MPISFADAAYEVLKKAGCALSADEITSAALSEGLVSTQSKTPSATMSARLYADVKYKGTSSRFVKVGRGKFGLREWSKLPPTPTPEPQLPQPRGHEEREKPAAQHNDLIEIMTRLGIALDREVHKEYKSPYRYDVPLTRTQYVPPDIVVEVCDKGSVDKDFSSLNWARENWNAKGLLVVVDDRDFEKARIVVGKTPNIFVMKAGHLRQLEALVAAGHASTLKALF